MKNRFISKEEFFREFNDLSVFQGKYYNYFRVAQSGLFSVYAQRQTKKSFFFKHNNLSLKVNFYFKNFFKRKNEIKNTSAEFFLSANKRLSFIEGEWKSVYIEKLIAQLGIENCHLHFRVNAFENEPKYHSTNQDVFIRKQILTKRHLEIFSDLKLVLNRIKEQNSLSDIEKSNIEIGFVFFYLNFVAYHNFFKEFSSLKKLFIYPAYQKEAFIIAAKENNLETIELQHGIIGKDSRFYVYPEKISAFKSNAFLPDKILVWGEYWKQRLEEGFEFNSEQIEIIGDFIHRKTIPESNAKDVLLITVNKYMQKPFIPFIKRQLEFIKEKHDGWKILLKLHPGDKFNHIYKNEFDSIELIDIAEKNQTLEDCLAVAKIQAGTFSLALFESLGFIKACFSINFENHGIGDTDNYQRFQNEMKQAKIADIVSENVDLVELFKHSQFTKRVNRDYVFKDFEFNG